MKAFLGRQGPLLGALGIGLAFRAGLLLFYLSSHGWKGETWEYEVIARNLLEGRGFVYDAMGCAYRSYVVPVFPVVCAFLHWVGGPGLGLFYAFHLAVAAGVMCLTYLLAGRWLGRATAVWAAWLVALEPGLILYQSYKVDVSPLACLLLLASLYGFLRLRESGGGRLAAVTGLCWGVGMLTRPDLLAAGAAPGCWIVAEAGKPRVRKAAAVALAGAVLALSPWVARNYAVHGRFVPFSTGGGWLFWAGNNPNGVGTLVTRDGKEMLKAAPEEFRRRLFSADELGRGDLFREEAWRYIHESPGAFFGGCARKLWNFWWFSPTFATKYYSWVGSWMVVVYKLVYSLVLALAALGLHRALRREGRGVRELTLCLAAVILAQACIHSLYYAETRHRLLIMPLLLVLAAHGRTAVLDFLGRGRTSRPPAGEPGAGPGRDASAA